MIYVERLITDQTQDPWEQGVLVRIAAMTPPSDKSPYNTPPTGFTEVGPEHIAERSCWGRYRPDAIEFRQFPVVDPKTGGQVYESLHLHYFWDNTGVAYSARGTIRWFVFGCVSEKHSIHSCPDCGHSATIDSSD